MLTIYKASAGSGKTYQLTLYYIKNLLGVKVDDDTTPEGTRWILNPALKGNGHPHTHRQILAITFTNKATEEMKSRIIKSLDDVARGEHEKYIETLVGLFGCSVEDLKKAARQALTSLLLDYKFFNVSTIDSFFQSILRSFAYELDVQGDYDVELGEKASIKDGLNEILEQVNYRRNTRRRRGNRSRGKGDTDEDETLDRIDRWIKTLVYRNLTLSKSYNPFQRERSVYSELVKQVSSIFKEDFKSKEEKMRKYLIERTGALERFESCLRAKPASNEQAGHDIARRLESILLKYGLDLDDLNGSTFRKQVKGLLETPVKWPSMTSAAMIAILKKDSSPALLFRQGECPGGLLASEEDTKEIRDAFTDLKRLIQQNNLIEVILDGLIYLEFTGYMLKTMATVNDEKNRIVLGDTNRLISRIIAGTDTPFIYERTGVYLKNFLIDEFQDTSRMQWQNLYPLVRNGLSMNEDSLIIGDTKQAIYRFRNSDSTMLGRTLREQDFADDDTVVVKGDKVEENTNYRTSETIVKFNNTLFPVLAEKFGQTSGYVGGGVVQQSPETKLEVNLPGHLTFNPYGGEGEPTIDDCAEDIVNKIKAAHDRGYRYKDMAILTRRNKDPQNVIDLLIREDIPVQARDNLFLASGRSVKMLVSLLHSFERTGRENDRSETEQKYIPYNDSLYIVSRIEYLRAADPELSFTEATDMAIEQFFNQREYAPEAALKEIAKGHPSSLAALVEAIVAAKLIPENVLKEEKDYIAAFVDIVTEYTEDNNDDLRGFLQYWESKKGSISLPPPPTTDAVSVMSVHQAKGLEWPIVFVPVLEWPLTPPESEIKWITTEDETDPRTGLTRKADLDVASALELDIDRDDIPPLLKVVINKSLQGLHENIDKLVDGIVSLQAVDTLNLMYVALTRPKSELHVYYKHEECANRCSGLLMKALDTISERTEAGPLETLLTEEIYDKQTGILKIGNPTTPKVENGEEKSGEGEPAEANRPVRVSIYNSRMRHDTDVIIKAKSIDVEDLEDIEDVDEDEGPTDEKKEKIETAATRGISLHSILEKVLKRSNLEDVLSRTAFESPEKEAETRELLTRALENPAVADWFADSPNVEEVRTEVPVFRPNILDMFDNGDISRIDRLVFHTDGSIEIIDYKFTTGRRNEDRQQLARYLNIIREVYPDRRVKGSLWYIDQNVISDLTWPNGSKGRTPRGRR